MTELEHERARKEGLEAAPRATQSANRARLWAGLNRYLAAEAEHERAGARRLPEQKERSDQGARGR